MMTLEDALKQASARTWKDRGGNRLVKVSSDWSRDDTMPGPGRMAPGSGGT